MVNFITYDDAEVFPGPRLNVVLGPNGTGKSTLTHAICLACAGKTSTVGRSSDLSQFVKKGKESAKLSYVEIDMLKRVTHDTCSMHCTPMRLFTPLRAENCRHDFPPHLLRCTPRSLFPSRPQGEVTTIRRDLKVTDNTSKWYLNGKMSTAAAVKSLMSELNIDVDNLCSFMAQDKVGNFTLQTPKQILQTTLQSIQDPRESKTLFDIQTGLANQEAHKLEQKRLLEAKVEEMNKTQRQIDDLAPEVRKSCSTQ